jgi:hypothetical protein
MPRPDDIGCIQLRDGQLAGSKGLAGGLRRNVWGVPKVPRFSPRILPALSRAANRPANPPVAGIFRAQSCRL